MKIDKDEFVDVLAGRVYHIAIVDDVYSENTSEADEDDDWDRPNTSCSHNIEGFTASPESEGKYYDLVVPFDPHTETPYYLLYVVYSTGDSFGHDEGNGIEHIGFYKEDQLHIARENLSKIEKHNRNRDNEDYDIVLKEPNGGKTFKQYTPWVGYFESLDYCDIIEVRRQEHEG